MDRSQTFSLNLNGERIELPGGTTIDQLLERLGISRHQAAVEVNHILVPRSDHERFELSEADEVEIVTLVGGG